MVTFIADHKRGIRRPNETTTESHGNHFYVIAMNMGAAPLGTLLSAVFFFFG